MIGLKGEIEDGSLICPRLRLHRFVGLNRIGTNIQNSSKFQTNMAGHGCTPPELYERWQHCMHYVPQFVTSCIETKRGKRKDMPEADILDQY